MTSKFEMLRRKSGNLQVEANDAKRALDEAVARCQHKWGPIIEDHIHQPGYIIPGDPPGYGGVDHRFDTHVDAKTTFRWKRICSECGEEQHTTNTKQQVTLLPQFNG